MRPLFFACLLSVGCMGSFGGPTGGGDGTGGGTSGTGGGTGGGSASLDGLPCEVATLVAARCVSCHGTSLVGGAPMSLVSRDDFLRASIVDANQTFGQRSVVRMRMTGASAMPPGAPPPTAEVDAFEAWVTAGMPAGACGGVDAGRQWPPDPTCLSGRFQPQPVDGDEHGGETMAPGWACQSCHSGMDFAGQNPGGAMSRRDTINQFMGTVFAAPHEKDLCQPSLPMSGSIQILDAMSDTVRLTIPFGASGNFRANAQGAMPSPYRARVVTANGSRTMNGPQTSGDCNTCHTVSGLQGAPGRIYLAD